MSSSKTSDDLPAIGSLQSSPLHELLLRAQASHRALVGAAGAAERRHPRDSLATQPSQSGCTGGASSIVATVWTVAGLMSSQMHRRSSGSIIGSCCCCNRDRSLAAALGGAAVNTKEKMAALTLTTAEEHNLLSTSRGSQLVTLGVRFSNDLLHNELEWTEDRPDCVLARFELGVERQIANSYLTGGLKVIWTKYDSKSYTLSFTLDQRSPTYDKQQNEELNNRVGYLINVIRKGCFWIEYPQSNLNFCPPQEAAIWTSKRMAIEAEFSSDDTA